MKKPNCLRAARIRAGMTLREAAQGIGVAHSTLHNMEFGQPHHVPVHIIKKLSVIYEEPPHKILNWQGDYFFMPAEPDSPRTAFILYEDHPPRSYLLAYQMMLNNYTVAELTDKYAGLSLEDQYTVTKLIDFLTHTRPS